MAYNKGNILKKSIEVVKRHKFVFIEDVVAYLSCSKMTFYRLKCYECDELKKLIEENKIKLKIKIRKKWLESNNPTLLLALYKLIGDDDERKKLSQTYVDLTSAGEKFEVAIEYIVPSNGEEKKENKD